MIRAPAEAAVDLRSRCADLFHDDLNPALRRLGERAMGAGANASPEPDDARARSGVWQTLAALGVLGAKRQVDLVDVSELMGCALYQSPFGDTVTAAELLAGTGDPAHVSALPAIEEGRRAVAVAVREYGHAQPSRPAALRLDAHQRVSAVRRYVAFAADVDDLVVIGTDAGRLVLALVGVDQPGVTVRRHDDIGRGDLYEVVLDRAEQRGEPREVGRAYPMALARARLRHAAYLAGAARGAIELAVSYLRTRTAFGQPLAKFQALAYRMAALTAEATAVLTLVRSVARDADRGDDVRLSGTQALFLAADAARQAAAEAVHLHGAFGMTERCDAQVFYRRAAVDALWLGTGTGLRQEAAELLGAAYAAAYAAAESGKDTPA